MEVITSNILHLGAIASEDEFQRGAQRRGGGGRQWEGEVGGSCNLHWIYKSPESNFKGKGGRELLGGGGHLVRFPRQFVIRCHL